MKKITQQLVAKRRELIPGGAHTYSKGDDQFASNAPKVMVRGQGAYVWGEDGKKYLDWCMGLRSVSLGHGNSVVNKAVAEQMKWGTNFGRPSSTEVELADFLVKLLPGADMVKFAKNGSTVTTAATKLARAYTGRKYIALCSSHPFFSYDDWFIGTTPCSSGVPQEIKDLSLTFKYNDYESLAQLFREHPGEIACVIMEVVTTEEPRDNFLKKVETLTKREGAVFILDEMITGFRYGFPAVHTQYGLKPDLTTYGKGIANGYSLAVLAGKKEIMELGGIDHAKERVFLVSTTHGAETIALAAARAAIQEMQRKKVVKHFAKMGDKLRRGLEKSIEKYGLEKHLEILGFAPNLAMNFKDEKGATSFLLKTLFLQEVTKRGILFQGYFATSFAHKEKEISYTIKAFDAVMKWFREVVRLPQAEQKKYLLGEVIKPVWRKYN